MLSRPAIGSGVEGPIQLRDDGRSFHVLTQGGERSFDDVERRCSERARSAAVFIAVTLQRSEQPMHVEAAALAEDPVSLQRASVVQRSARPGRRWRLAMEALGRFEAGPRESASALATGGASLRVDVGAQFNRLFVGATVGAAGEARTTLSVPGGSARLLRVPLDIGARVGFRRSWLEVGGDLGLSVGIVDVVGDVAMSREAAGAEPGVRGAIWFRAWPSEVVGAVLSVEAVYVPRPHNIQLSDLGVVATLPPVWLSTSLGLVFRIH